MNYNFNDLTRLYEKYTLQGPTYNFKYKDIDLSFSYIQIGIIIFLVFLLILMLARVRRMYYEWSMKGAVSMLLIGAIVIVIIEGVIFYFNQNTFKKVLGVQSPNSVSPNQIIENYSSLTPKEARVVRKLICE